MIPTSLNKSVKLLISICWDRHVQDTLDHFANVWVLHVSLNFYQNPEKKTCNRSRCLANSEQFKLISLRHYITTYSEIKHGEQV